MKKISIGLDTKQIQKAIDRLNSLKENIKKETKKILEEVAGNAAVIVRKESPVDTGETRNSTDIKKISDTELQLYQEGTHVFDNEFGLGIKGLFTVDAKEPIPTGWRDKYSNKPIRYKATNPSSKYYKNGKYGISPKGQIANMQMFKASLYIKQELAKKIKAKVGELISKA